MTAKTESTFTDVYLEEELRAFELLKDAQKKLKQQLDDHQAKVIAYLKDKKITKYEGESGSLSYVAPINKVHLNTKLIKTEYPEVYKALSEPVTTKESLRVTIKK